MIKAGKELDNLIDIHVMGFDPNMTSTRRFVPDYSTDIKVAWQVVGKIDNLGLEGIRWWKLEKGPGGKYHMMLRDYAQNGAFSYHVEADTAPHAICQAALKAMGKIKGDKDV